MRRMMKVSDKSEMHVGKEGNANCCDTNGDIPMLQVELLSILLTLWGGSCPSPHKMGQSVLQYWRMPVAYVSHMNLNYYVKNSIETLTLA